MASGSTRGSRRPPEPRVRPNYFLAVRVTNPEILDAAKCIQETIVEVNENLSELCASIPRIHLTLFTVRIDDERQLEAACEVLRSLQPSISSLLPPPTSLYISGLNNFYHKILFMGVEADPALHRFRDDLLSRFKNAGVREVGNKPKFTPHVTLAKMTHSDVKEMNIPFLDERLCPGFKDTHFGVQQIEGVHLCEISGRTEDDGFYKTAFTLNVNTA